MSKYLHTTDIDTVEGNPQLHMAVSPGNFHHNEKFCKMRKIENPAWTMDDVLHREKIFENAY